MDYLKKVHFLRVMLETDDAILLDIGGGKARWLPKKSIAKINVEKGTALVPRATLDNSFVTKCPDGHPYKAEPEKKPLSWGSKFYVPNRYLKHGCSEEIWTSSDEDFTWLEDGEVFLTRYAARCSLILREEKQRE